MKEIFVLAYLALQPSQPVPSWLEAAYERQFATRAECTKVIEVIEDNNLYDTTNLHCLKVKL